MQWDSARPESLQDPRALKLAPEHVAAGLVIVFEYWGAPAGFAVVVPRDDGAADIDGPFVEPDLWGGGIGRSLVEEATLFARALEARELFASANARAEPFYAKCGFKPASRIETAHGPVCVMSLSLSEVE